MAHGSSSAPPGPRRLAVVTAVAGSCDTHMHIYDPAFAPPAGALMPRIGATVADYRRVMDDLGIARCIVVQPSAYAFDNACTEAAIVALGVERARGVAMVRGDIGDAELHRLNRAGFRGARFHVGWGGAGLWSELARLAPRLADIGWQASVQFNGRALPERFALLNGLPCTLVVEHAGKFDPIAGVNDPEFALLKRLLDNGRTWVKLSEPYAVSRSGPPGYADFAALARALAAHAPHRMIWATNWPHPSATGAIPENTSLAALLAEWVPDAVARRAILAENPTELFGFGRSNAF